MTFFILAWSSFSPSIDSLKATGSLPAFKAISSIKLSMAKVLANNPRLRHQLVAKGKVVCHCTALWMGNCIIHNIASSHGANIRT
jgi:fluoride ion exporter CrcB/FEX